MSNRYSLVSHFKHEYLLVRINEAILKEPKAYDFVVKTREISLDYSCYSSLPGGKEAADREEKWTASDHVSTHLLFFFLQADVQLHKQ